MVILLIIITFVAIYAGRILFHRWFNPLSIYSALWGFCLCNYELGLIQYYSISITAWCYITAAWIALYLGSAIVILLMAPTRDVRPVRLLANTDRIKKAILVLSAIGLVGLASQLLAVRREFGSVINAIFANANDLYSARTANQISGIPYAGSFSYAACTLAGIYVAKLGRFTLTAVLPIVLIAIQTVFVMGRTGLGIAAVLFFAAAVYTPRDPGMRTPRWQRRAGVSILATFLVGAFVLISSVRGLSTNFPGTTPEMERISEYIPSAPSLYSNFSATPVAFSMYLSAPHEEQNDLWGMYTFAPLFRFLARLGFPTTVANYEENYWTPVPMNTATYLKNIYSDFGPAGILLFPLFLGGALTFLIFRSRVNPGLATLALLSNFYVLIVFSFAFNFMLLGDWYIGVFVAIFACAWIGSEKTQTRPFAEIRQGV